MPPCTIASRHDNVQPQQQLLLGLNLITTLPQEKRPMSADLPTDLPNRPHPLGSATVSLADFQSLIYKMYFEKDQARGVEGTFLWLMEEIGELATALRNGTHEQRLEEFADVLAWLTTIANVAGVDLTEAVTRKYGRGCPGCGQFVCQCPDSEKP
jgi:NTP pyrophosphatase (non-canonical NTP hydrolase)